MGHSLLRTDDPCKAQQHKSSFLCLLFSVNSSVADANIIMGVTELVYLQNMIRYFSSSSLLDARKKIAL